jgi:hypothetical protein
MGGGGGGGGGGGEVRRCSSDLDKVCIGLRSNFDWTRRSCRKKGQREVEVQH